MRYRHVLTAALFVLFASPTYAQDKDHLVDQAAMAYEIGDYASCAEKLSTAIRLGAQNITNFYNLACCFSLHEQPDEALTCLEQAIARGYRDLERLVGDADLYSLHPLPKWGSVVKLCRAKQNEYFSEINVELYQIFREDQTDRKSDSIDWAVVESRDADRRARVRQMLNSGMVNAADDYFHAGMILHHGRDSADYDLAHQLACRAFALDSSHTSARWLAATAKDRYLWSIGRPQWYGTQSRLVDSVWTIDPIDTTAVTDDDRDRMGCPTLGEARRRMADRNR
jgi:tetratricopeptide (TPR) repeat protein